MKCRMSKALAAVCALGVAAAALPAFPARAAGKQLIHEIRAVTDALPVYGQEAAYFDLQITEGLPVVIEDCWWECMLDGGSIQYRDQDIIDMEGQYVFEMVPRIPEALSDAYGFAGDLKIYVNDTLIEAYRGVADEEMSVGQLSLPYYCYFEVTQDSTVPIGWSMQGVSIDGSTLSWDAYTGAKSYMFGLASSGSEMIYQQLTDTSVDLDACIEQLAREVQVDPAELAGQTMELSLIALDTDTEKGNALSAEWTGTYVYRGDAPYISSQSPDVVYFVPGTGSVDLFVNVANSQGDLDYKWTADSDALGVTRSFIGAGNVFAFSGMDLGGSVTKEYDGTVIRCEVTSGDTTLTSRKITLRAASLGDANADGSVGLLDVVAVQRYLVRQPSQVHVNLCDLDKDDCITVLDLSLLKSYVTRALEEQLAAQTVALQFDFPGGFTVGHMIYLSEMQLHYEDARIGSAELAMSGSSHVLQTDAGKKSYHIVTGEVYQEGSSYTLTVSLHCTDEEAASSIVYATLNGSEPVSVEHASAQDVRVVFDLGYPAAG